jgi:hypothetical protein
MNVILVLVVIVIGAYLSSVALIARSLPIQGLHMPLSFLVLLEIVASLKDPSDRGRVAV